MKSILAAIILVLAATHLRAAEVILPYSAFGPQSAAHELIGMAWWQWDSQGEDDDRDYPIKVVVYCDQTKEETAKRHPVDQAKPQDFRYVEYSKAIEHLEHTIKDFMKAKLDAKIMESALAQLEKHKEAEQAAPRNR
jgi:hypothetical protein